MITVEHLYNRKKQLKQLKFELHDLLDKHPVDYFHGQLWMDVLYTSMQKSNESQFDKNGIETAVRSKSCFFNGKEN